MPGSSKLRDDETLFKNIEVFSPSFVPEDFMFRDSEMKELASCIKPAIKGGKAMNVFVVGKPATGKTTAVRKIFKEAEGEGSKMVTVHINCHIYSSYYRMLSEIHKKIFGFMPAETGSSVSKLYDKIFLRLAKEKKSLVVALDDLDFNSASEVIYNLLKAHEVHGVKTAIWCISTTNEMHVLDDRSRSLFTASVVKFSPYTSEQLKNILKSRAIEGLFSNVINDQVLMVLSGQSSDVRQAIEMLKKTVMIAEGKGSKKIMQEHALEAIKSFEAPPIATPGDENVLLGLIKGSMESGDLYERYKDATNSSYSKFYRLLKKLKERGAIDVAQLDKKRGKTSMISLRTRK